MARSNRATSKRNTRAGNRTNTRRKQADMPREPSRIEIWWAELSVDTKVDLLGGLLALLGAASLISLISTAEAGVARWWNTALRAIGGEAAFFLPLLLVVVGAWLVLRRVESLSRLTWQHIAGGSLLYLNLLTWTHLLRGGGWQLAKACTEAGKVCRGGGYLGAGFERLLNGSLGGIGAAIVLLIWGLLAILLMLRITFPVFAGAINQNTQRFLAWWDETYGGWLIRREAQRRAELNQRREAARAALAEAYRTPDDFKPLPGRDGEPIVTAPDQPAREERENKRAAKPEKASGEQRSAPPSAPAPAPQGPAWQLPVIAEILDPPTMESQKTNIDQDRARVIEETLGSFGAPVHVVDISRGPTVTQFGVEPDFIETRSGRTRVRVGKIASLADDLALALAAQRIRIQAPVPGRSFVGIEVPNSEASRVMLRETIESDAFQKLRSPLRIAIGKDVSGRSVAYDLASMPHLLIAGTTGSGKSVCVNAMLSCLLLNNSPRDMRMVLVDPKRVELTGYNGIPHLLTPVITDADKVIGALQWVLREMDARFTRFAQVGVRNIGEYNRRNQPGLPFLLVLIDELADLMMLAPDETERSLTRLAQLARATGIHLVLATQRPSVDVVTGLIKANFPSRIAFAVASQIDSRVILDQPGAERLLGKGDMLFQAPDAPAPYRLQGVWVSDSEIQRLIDFWRTQDYMLRQKPGSTQGEPQTTAEPVNMDMALSTPLHQSALFDGEMGSKDGDPVFDEAVEIVRNEGKASISMLQRKMRIGYTRAARLIDKMEETGIVGPPVQGSQVRAVMDAAGEEAEPEG